MGMTELLRNPSKNVTLKYNPESDQRPNKYHLKETLKQKFKTGVVYV